MLVPLAEKELNVLRLFARSSLALGLFLATSVASAGIVNLTDTQPMIDFPDANCSCGDLLPAELPFALFDFTGQPSLGSIKGLSITLTMQDGDTGLGQFDRDQLSLALDGVSTGLLLNGFNQGEENTLTFSLEQGDANWLSNDSLNQLLAALGDNQLLASILDASPDDNGVLLYSFFDTTITLWGDMLSGGDPVPEPASLAIWGLGAALLIGRRLRRK